MTSKAWTVAAAAADEFLTALEDRIAELPAKVDLTAEIDSLRAAMDGYRPGSAEPAIAAARRMFDTTPLPGVSAEFIRADALTGSRRVIEALDMALTVFDRQDELDAAEAHVSEMETALAKRLSELEDAVSTADIDRVMALRPDVEIRIPVELGKARLSLLDLQLARAQAARHRPQVRIDQQSHRVDCARQALADAQAQVQAATRELHEANQDLMRAEVAVSNVDTTVDRLAAERDRLAADIRDDEQRRLRRLAGLPDDDAARTASVKPRKKQSMLTTVRNLADGHGSKVPSAEPGTQQFRRKLPPVTTLTTAEQDRLVDDLNRQADAVDHARRHHNVQVESGTLQEARDLAAGRRR